MIIRRILLVGLVIVAALVCFGCAEHPTRIKGGEEVAPPWGWMDYCQRHPEDRACVEVTK